MEAIFVPIRCAACKRQSALSIPGLDIRRKLETGEPIELRCAYDGLAWEATSRERLQIQKLCSENDLVARSILGRVSGSGMHMHH